MAIFSFIFLPGVFLHELSHFIMAKLLGVRTGRFSLLPQSLPDGRLQLGYVETTRSDIVRDSLIGAAPLIVMALWIGLYPKPFFEILEQPVNNLVLTVRPNYPGLQGSVNAVATPATAPPETMQMDTPMPAAKGNN